jgi:hypothetical protein
MYNCQFLCKPTRWYIFKTSCYISQIEKKGIPRPDCGRPSFEPKLREVKKKKDRLSACEPSLDKDNE